MKFFLDSADVAEIKTWAATGLVDGVTTNPTTIATTAPSAAEEPAGPWARAAIALMIQKGLFQGYPGGAFDWTQPLSRQEAALVIARLIAQYGLDKFNPEEIALLGRAIEELQRALQQLQTETRRSIADLQRQIDELRAQNANVAALEARVQRLELEVQRLLEIINALESGASNAELAEAMRRIEELTPASMRSRRVNANSRRCCVRMRPPRRSRGCVRSCVRCKAKSRDSARRCADWKVASMRSRRGLTLWNGKIRSSPTASLPLERSVQDLNTTLGRLGDLVNTTAEAVARTARDLETLQNRVAWSRGSRRGTRRRGW
ncbi:MAG: hypothetical protein HC933_19075 [Pleurocapsa sp. SU_196_0]|nr:hypothetical protein [Pleurocapsa sp. SU_196_0]